MSKLDSRHHKPPQDELDEIAARLVLSREAMGLKANALCRLAGIKTAAYSQWENGRGAPRLDQARLLRRTLGYTLDWIYEGDRSGLPMKLATAIAAFEAKKAQQTPVKAKVPRK